MKTAYRLVLVLTALTAPSLAAFQPTTSHASSRVGSRELSNSRLAPGSPLPLAKGNFWRYASHDGSEPLVQEVRVRSSTASLLGGTNPIEHYVLDNYFFGIAPSSPAFAELDGGLHEVYLGDLHLFYPWPDQSQPFEIPALQPDCMHGSVGVFETLESITVPVGTFEQPISVRYIDVPCRNASPAREVFVPGVGLVERKTLSIEGVRTWSLVYAQVNGRVYGEPPIPRVESDGGGDGERVSITWGGVKTRYR